MESLPKEIIINEISSWLLSIDKQILRRINTNFHKLFPYEEIKFNETNIELIHLIKYKKLWDCHTIENIAKIGNLDCLKYAHENEYHWGNRITSSAALNGHLDCLKYAHENGCIWDNETTSSAAKNGHIDCLKYAHENGCPWNVETTKYAAENGHLDCLR